MKRPATWIIGAMALVIGIGIGAFAQQPAPSGPQPYFVGNPLGMPINPAPDGKSMMAHLQDQQVMVTRAARRDKISVRLGVDDRIFLLRRTAAKDCDFVRDAVTTPEPPRQQR